MPLLSLAKSSAGMILAQAPPEESTTLYGLLRYILSPEKQIITDEDPIEYTFKGIRQCRVKPQINLVLQYL